jgi:hypothetical protein
MLRSRLFVEAERCDRILNEPVSNKNATLLTQERKPDALGTHQSTLNERMRIHSATDSVRSLGYSISVAEC